MDDTKKASLVKAFEKTGLGLRFLSRPPAFTRTDGREVFFCTIERAKGKTTFAIWPGGEKNRIEVLASDKDLRQLVLMAHEPARKFTVTEYDSATRKHVEREMKVSEVKRKFLLGFDERDAFMAQMPSSMALTTVAQAHARLRNPNLPKDKKVVRQGEWFFFKATAEELGQIEANKLVIERKTRIEPSERRGNPHVADEYIELKTEPDIVTMVGPSSYQRRMVRRSERKMFVRGKVRHIDHATVEFSQWHRVVRNTEDRGADARWID